MTEQLQQAIDRLQQLPAEAQNAIAERILDDLDEREWDEIISKPRVQQRLAELADMALRAHQAGETREGGFGES